MTALGQTAHYITFFLFVCLSVVNNLIHQRVFKKKKKMYVCMYICVCECIYIYI